MYNIVNKFILQKPVINFKEFSLFLPLFNSTPLEHMKERNWLLKLLVNGLKDQQDYYLYRKHHVFELCIAYYDSPLVEKLTKVSDSFMGSIFTKYFVQNYLDVIIPSETLREIMNCYFIFTY